MPDGSRRAVLPAALVLILTLCGWTSASPSPDEQTRQLAVALEEDGYHVDPGSGYFTTDEELDGLRSATERQSTPVFVAALAPEAPLDGVVDGLLASIARSGTVVVIAGDRWEAGSDLLVEEQVVAAYRAAGTPEPDRAALAFLDLLPLELPPAVGDDPLPAGPAAGPQVPDPAIQGSPTGGAAVDESAAAGASTVAGTESVSDGPVAAEAGGIPALVLITAVAAGALVVLLGRRRGRAGTATRVAQDAPAPPGPGRTAPRGKRRDGGLRADSAAGGGDGVSSRLRPGSGRGQTPRP